MATVTADTEATVTAVMEAMVTADMEATVTAVMEATVIITATVELRSISPASDMYSFAGKHLHRTLEAAIQF